MAAMKQTGRREWTEEEIEEIARNSPEFPEVTDEDLARAVAVSGTGRRKVPISIRIDEDALEHVRSLGGRYQTRINDVLVAFAEGRMMEIPQDWAEAFAGKDAAAEVRRIVSGHLRGGGRTRETPFVRAAGVRAHLVHEADAAPRWTAGEIRRAS
jgi:uncharacterized protein (DUF4415 family)